MNPLLVPPCRAQMVKPMVFRLSAKLAAKLHTEPCPAMPLALNPYADWSAHLFTADRTQYILLSNTASLYSTVFYGRGFTHGDVFLDRAMGHLGGYLRGDGFEPVYEHHVVPEAGRILLCGALSRSVTGSMSDLVRLAKRHLVEQGRSPDETAHRLNETPMSRLGYGHPRAAFAALRTDLEEV